MIQLPQSFLLILIILFNSSCNVQVQSKSQMDEESNKQNPQVLVKKKMEPYKYGAGDVITRGYLDNLGNMWFTTLKEGVFKYDGKTFRNFTVKDGLCSNMVNVVIEDKSGVIWFGTAKGLCRYDGKNFINLPLPQEETQSVSVETGLPSSKTESVLSLMQASNGDFWIGTAASGAYRYDGKSFTSFLKFEGRVHPDNNVYNNCIQSIVEDNSGNIWFTSMTHGGISRYDGKKMTHFTKKEGLSDDMIFSSFKDADGKLWFGTLDNGLILYNKGSFSCFKEKEWQNVSCFYQDKVGKLWIGSFRESAVSWFDGEKFMSVPFDKNQKLVEIRFITEDKEGNIWFGGRYGILWRYDGEVLKDFTQLKRN